MNHIHTTNIPGVFSIVRKGKDDMDIYFKMFSFVSEPKSNNRNTKCGNLKIQVHALFFEKQIITASFVRF